MNPRRAGQTRTAMAVLVSALVCAACAASTSPGSSPPGTAALRVVATTTVVADFARQIGGDRVAVTGLLKPNVDAHDLDPSPADLDAIGRADLVVVNGLGLESWLDATIAASGTKATVVDTSAGITLVDIDDIDDDDEDQDEDQDEDHEGDHEGEDRDEDEDGHDHGDVDPHVWHDPIHAIAMVSTIAEAFARADPEGASLYEANRVAYVDQLTALDAEIRTRLAPITTRLLVTNHDAFGYFARRYDLTVVGSVIPSFDTSAELSAGELDDLVTTIRELGVRAVFAESSLPSKTARTIAEEAGVAVVEGDAALYGDGLGAADSPAATYLTMMRHNSNTIAANLS